MVLSLTEMETAAVKKKEFSSFICIKFEINVDKADINHNVKPSII
jgi:hypothetical protein